MRHVRAYVFFHGQKAGVLSREEEFYRFQYDREYVINGGEKISFSLPVTTESYDSVKLHGFFSGLVAEGWLKNLQSKTQRIDETDEFSLLVANGEDLIGAVTIELQNMY